MRNLDGRSSSYGRWSAYVFGTLMPRAQACTVCLGRDQRSTDVLRLWNLRCPTLYRKCFKSVCEREREREQCSCASECYIQWSATVFATLMLRLVQVCLSIVQTEALPLLKLMPGPYTDVPGRLLSAC